MTEVDYPRCGAPTKNGKPCRTRLSAYDSNPERCRVHRDAVIFAPLPDPLAAVRMALHEAIMTRMHAGMPHEDLLEIKRMLPTPKDLTA